MRVYKTKRYRHEDKQAPCIGIKSPIKQSGDSLVVLRPVVLFFFRFFKLDRQVDGRLDFISLFFFHICYCSYLFSTIRLLFLIFAVKNGRCLCAVPNVMMPLRTRAPRLLLDPTQTFSNVAFIFFSAHFFFVSLLLKRKVI